MKKFYNDVKDHILVERMVASGTGSPSPNFKFYKILFLVFFLTAFVVEAEASHFRYGNLTWRVVSGRTVEFTLTTSWRSDFISNGFVRTGDGYYANQISNNITSNVNGVATLVQVFRHTYASDGPFTANYSSCCRIGGLSNGGSSWNVWTIVNLQGGNENSPVSSLPAVVNVPINSSNATFQVPANDLDGDNLTYRLATISELGGSGSIPPGLSINSETGEATINTSLSNYAEGQLWFAGIVISDGKASILIDFLISIKQQSTPPAFLFPPTPADGTVLQVSPGQNINFDVSASDTDAGDQVARLFVTGIPSGATFATASGNPATSTFNWTPTSSDFGSKVLNFIAEDNAGVQSSSSVTIQVSLKPKFDIPPTPATNNHIIVEPGQLISYSVQASDPDPDDVVQIIMVEGKDASGNKIPLYAGASFSPLPTSAGNPTSGTFSWIPQVSDWGNRHIFITAEDSYGDRTVHEISQLINSTPSFVSTPVTTADVGQLYEYHIEAIDDDVPFGDQLAILSSQALPGWLTLTDNGDGTAILRGTPGPGDAGLVTISLQAEDINHHTNIGGMPVQSFDITVNNCIVNAATKDITVLLDSDGNAVIEATEVDDNSTATCGIASLTLDISSFSCSDIGPNTVTLTVTDINDNSESTTATVTVKDEIAPEVLAKATHTVSLDATGNGTLSVSDVLTAASTDACGIKSEVLSKTNFNCSDIAGNPVEVTLTVTDNNNNITNKTIAITVEDKVNPSITAPTDIIIGNDADLCSATVTLGSATASDNCSDVTVTNDAPLGNVFPIGTTRVTWTAIDGSGNSATAIQQITVTNDVPVISSITAPLDPQQINSIFSVSASFVDNNLSTASWNWGDDSSSAGTIVGSAVNGSHSYATPGVYTISCSVTDACGESASLEYQYVVAYDPYGGFVTGGGWINSPAGAYVDDPSAVGKANFGFVAKYQNGANVPQGNTEFKFRAGNLDFRSTAYEWLVIAGHKAMYKGSGTINGGGTYGFQLSAVDGDRKGSGEPDRIRMKIWDSSGAVVYDNQMGDADDAEALMALGGGSIVIHDGKNNKASARESELTLQLIPSFEGFSAYPVPLSDAGLWLEFPALEKEGNFQVSIYDLHGRQLAQKQFWSEKAGSKQLWDLNHQTWVSGMYVLIIQGEGMRHQQKLTK